MPHAAFIAARAQRQSPAASGGSAAECAGLQARPAPGTASASPSGSLDWCSAAAPGWGAVPSRVSASPQGSGTGLLPSASSPPPAGPPAAAARQPPGPVLDPDDPDYTPPQLGAPAFAWGVPVPAPPLQWAPAALPAPWGVPRGPAPQPLGVWAAPPPAAGDSRPPTEPEHSLEAGLRAMVAGAWWLKWSDPRSPVRQRWVWIDRRGWVLYWAKTEDARAFHSGVMALNDVHELSRSTFEQYVPGEHRKRRFWVVRLTTHHVGTSHHLFLASRDRTKFDLWYATLAALTKRSRLLAAPPTAEFSTFCSV
eukprot:TRINITY_DN55787_c0_g1_i1.p1 TRINITY_DN55787_c0_g1~~TRINITY_DN55787_c0_g1_i1.p1  ORF type:complete len:333 (+),score=71.21 TRINITY_DN55787_c0_g1_i1:75-1001(+)